MELFLTDSKLYDFLKEYEKLLRSIFIVSSVDLTVNTTAPANGYTQSELFDGLFVKVTHAEGEKCGRCWKYDLSVGRVSEHPTLCETCISLVQNIDAQK